MGAIRSAYMAKAMGSASSRLVSDIGNIYAHKQEEKEKARKSEAVENLMEAIRELKGENVELNASDLPEQPRSELYSGEDFSDKFKIDGEGVGGKVSMLNDEGEAETKDATPKMKIKEILSSSIYNELQSEDPKGALANMIAELKSEIGEGRASKDLTAKQKREDDSGILTHKRNVEIAEIKAKSRKDLEKTKGRERRKTKKVVAKTKVKNFSNLYLKMVNTQKEAAQKQADRLGEDNSKELAKNQIAIREMENSDGTMTPEEANKTAREKAKNGNSEYMTLLNDFQSLCEVKTPEKKEKLLAKIWRNLKQKTKGATSLLSGSATEEETKKVNMF